MFCGFPQKEKVNIYLSISVIPVIPVIVVSELLLLVFMHGSEFVVSLCISNPTFVIPLSNIDIIAYEILLLFL